MLNSSCRLRVVALSMLLGLACSSLRAGGALHAAQRLAPPSKPAIVGGGTSPGYKGWLSIVGMPDLGLGQYGNASWNTPHMQPVDFGVWQAADGTWQLQSCIRNTCLTGCDASGQALHWNHSRLFFRWESEATNTSTFPTSPAEWRQVGVVMIGEPEYGEDVGGLQAPHVTRWGDPPQFHMFYGSWWSICQAVSEDGKAFKRVLDSEGKASIFTEGGHPGDGAGGEGANTRDPMLFAIPAAPGVFNFRIVYSAFPQMAGRRSDGVWSRTLSLAGNLDGPNASRTLTSWGAWGQTVGSLVGYGGSAGEGGSASECPFVHYHEASGYYYLFRTQEYSPKGGQTSVYASRDPSNFGVGVVSAQAIRIRYGCTESCL